MNIPMKDAFAAWIGTAEKGDEFIYAPDAPTVTTTTGSTPIAQQARRYYEKGLVILFQRRKARDSAPDGGGVFDYVAKRTGRAA